MKTENGIKHILVVDDEESVRSIFQRALASFGYECLSAENGEEALRILHDHSIDVVITDVRMPGMDGMELTRRIKSEYTADVIVVTGFAENMRYDAIVKNGASDFLRKPVPIEELLARVQRVLRERENIAARKEVEEILYKSYVKLRNVLDTTELSLSAAMEKRDPYTAGHQKRVAMLGCAIGKEIGLGDIQIEGLRVAGLLHDIGKISVPSDILNKPSKLNVHEFNLIKEHPETGYEIISGIDFDQPVARIILQHHETLNGTGYPQGLSGDDILYEAKIISVADVVEAVNSHRPYRPALGLKKALEIITQGRGILYDAMIVDTCVALFEKNMFAFE